QTLWFAAGYPYDWLAALAARLGQHSQVPWAEDHDDAPAVKIVPFFMTHIRDEDTFDQPVQPLNSRVVVESKEDGLTVLRVPRDRSWSGPAAIPLMLLPFFGLFGVLIGMGMLPWPLPVIVGPALLAVVSIPLLWHVWTRWTVLAVSEEGLGVLRTGG